MSSEASLAELSGGRATALRRAGLETRTTTVVPLAMPGVYPYLHRFRTYGRWTPVGPGKLKTGARAKIGCDASGVRTGGKTVTMS